MNDGTFLNQSESARVGLLDRVSVPWHVALGASAENTFVHNPLHEIRDFGELYFANHPDEAASVMSQAGGSGDMPTPQPDSADAFIDPKTLNTKYGQSTGLTFDQPMRAGAVAIMVRRKQEEIARNAFIDRAPTGLAYGIANLGTQLAVSATDPLNVASAFIPIVGEARQAIWAARYGKVASRFATGAIEGSVGAAAIEPINYGASKYLGDDYTMADSLMNVALGGVLGGGLHVGFGALSDHLSRLAPETREATLRGALANMAEGRPVQIDHIITTDPLYRRFDELPTIKDLTLQAEEARLQAQHTELGTQVAALPPGDATAHDRLTRLGTVEDQLKNPEIEAEVRKILGVRRDEILTNTTPEKLKADAQPIIDRRDLTARQDRITDQIKDIQKQRTDLGVQRAMTPPAIAAASDRAAARFRGLHATEAPDPAALLAAQRDGSLQLQRAADTHNAQATDAARTATVAYGKNAEPGTAIPPDSSARGDAILKEKQGDDLDAELQEAHATIDAYEKQGALTPEEAAQARSGKEGIADAAKRGRAAKAAAVCLNLHP
jgi:hypothetical protein